MSEIENFKTQAKEIIDWIAEYYEKLEEFPVKAQVKPGEIKKQLPGQAPFQGESFETMMTDFKDIILPGITHWQSPNFYAYFPANSSFPSLLGEFLTAALGAQCMKWETSPSATELEEVVMNWLRDMLRLDASFHGVIQDSASSSTLAAILAAREKSSNFQINKKGFEGLRFRVYCSNEAHSSIEKAVKIAGIGSENLIKIQTDAKGSLIPAQLEAQIQNDLRSGYQPIAVIAAFGTTGTTAVDPLEEIGQLCATYKLWYHIDAAYAGSALILPEYEHYLKGVNMADSFVFNPHKWLFTNFDVSAFFIKDKESLLKTFQLVPVYLQTESDDMVNNYSDWGVQLGRRFRALKLWFVLRSFGIEGLRKRIREHIALAETFETWIEKSDCFELLAPRLFNVVGFRYCNHAMTENELDAFNEKLLKRINGSGKIYLTHTRFYGKYILRFVVGQTNVNLKHVEKAFLLIRQMVMEI